MKTSELTGKILSQLAQDIASGDIPAGEHISTQQIANRYSVSRTPVRDALIELRDLGLLDHQQNRGYFVTSQIPENAIEKVSDTIQNKVEDYQKIAEDWLTDELPEIVTEHGLRQRYGLTKAKLNEVLARAAREGWAERKDGYGWRLLPVAKTAEAFDEIYRFRMAIEPSAMLEPGFEIDRKVLEEQRRIQENMLDADLNSVPAKRILDNGSLFHEEIIKLSNNHFFLTALQRVNRMRRLMEYRAEVNRERVVGQCGEHLEILKLLENGQIADASYLMRRHLSGALKRKSPISWKQNDTDKDFVESAPN